MRRQRTREQPAAAAYRITNAVWCSGQRRERIGPDIHPSVDCEVDLSVPQRTYEPAHRFGSARPQWILVARCGPRQVADNHFVDEPAFLEQDLRVVLGEEA